MVFVGPSGCGKSTTLRMIAGLEEISERRHPHRRQARQRRPAQGPRHRHGLPELRALSPHERVREHGLRPANSASTPRRRSQKRVGEAAAILGIEDCLDRKPKALSGGQRQRVAVGRAIVRKPKVFLFDEPLSNLDAKMRVQMRTEIIKLHHASPGHDDLRHPRPGRGHDHGRPHRRDEGRPSSSRPMPRSHSTASRPTSSWPASSAARR